MVRFKNITAQVEGSLKALRHSIPTYNLSGRTPTQAHLLSYLNEV